MPDSRRIPSGNTPGGRMRDGMTGITLPCVTKVEVCAGRRDS
jgi:hypothetical protein